MVENVSYDIAGSYAEVSGLRIGKLFRDWWINFAFGFDFAHTQRRFLFICRSNNNLAILFAEKD